MDAIIVILIIIIFVLLFKRTWSSAIYAICIVDIFLRLIDFLKDQIPALRSIFGSVPASLNSIICNYTSGIFELILLWVVFVVYLCFLFYVFRTFLKKK